MRAAILAAIFAALSAAAFSQTTVPYDPPMVKGMPTDVAAYLERQGMCGHFGGEEAYDEERRQELIKASQELRCDRLRADAAALRQAYATDAAVLERMKKADETY